MGTDDVTVWFVTKCEFVYRKEVKKVRDTRRGGEKIKKKRKEGRWRIESVKGR